MKYKRTGVVKSSELSEVSEGILLRSEAGWRYPITIGKKIMLILPDGSFYHPKVTGGETMTTDPAIVIELIPEINNEVPTGTRVYVDNEDAESAKRLAFWSKQHKT